METRQVQQIKVAAALGAAPPHEYSVGLMRSGKQVAGEGLFGLTFKTVFGTSPVIWRTADTGGGGGRMGRGVSLLVFAFQLWRGA